MAEVCRENLKLLFAWSCLNKEYTRTLLASMNTKTPTERYYLSAALDDVRWQAKAAKETYKSHIENHGC